MQLLVRMKHYVSISQIVLKNITIVLQKSFLIIGVFTLFLFQISCNQLVGQELSFSDLNRNTKGVLNAHWHETDPFIFRDQNENLAGIEYEILLGFEDFIERTYGLNLIVDWVQDPSFNDVLNQIQLENVPNHIGAAAISITEERSNFVDFSDPYLPEISVLISNDPSLKLKNYSDLKRIAETHTAISIKGTTYDEIFDDLSKELDINFKIRYVPNNSDIVEKINETEKCFGFIDLPVYLLYLKNGSKVRRYDEFTVKGKGFGFIFPKGSDWIPVFNEYLAQPETKLLLTEIFVKYLGKDISEFFNEMNEYSGIQTPLFAKEKELVQQNFETTARILEREQRLRKYQTILSGIVFLLVIIMVVLLLNMRSNNIKLRESEAKLREESEQRAKDNQRLINRNTQIKQLSSDRKKLYQMIVHDLKSPVNNIKGITELLKMDPAIESLENASFIPKISESCEKMIYMIEQIISKESNESNSSQLLTEEVSIVQMMRSLKRSFDGTAQAKKINLHFSTEIPEYRISSDYLLLNQLFENLISNALKFSSPEQNIWIKVAQNNDEIVVKIKDEGPGFSKEDKKMLFTAFKKLSSTPTAGESSTGLGLSIVKRCVDSLGARIELDSEKNQGAEFTVFIPA